MKYFAVFLPMRDPEKSKHYRPDHLQYLARMKAEGRLFACGRFLDGAGGLVIYTGELLEEVQSYAEKDPYVLNEARGLDIHEWDMVFEPQLT